MRTLRLAPPQADFDARAVPAVDESRLAVVGAVWTRLFRRAYPGQFYPSAGSRLTPSSRAFPCVYLGASAQAAVAEVWGDRFQAQRASGRGIYAIEASTADAHAFLRVDAFPALRLCDLTDGATLLAVGLDLASLYATDLSVPQGWAEVIARHPAGFDGIVYRSRHTGEDCVVLWVRPGGRALDGELVFSPAGEFRESVAAYAVAKQAGLTLAFVD